MRIRAGCRSLGIRATPDSALDPSNALGAAMPQPLARYATEPEWEWADDVVPGRTRPPCSPVHVAMGVPRMGLIPPEDRVFLEFEAVTRG